MGGWEDEIGTVEKMGRVGERGKGRRAKVGRWEREGVGKK
jgi:hypothetical protein